MRDASFFRFLPLSQGLARQAIDTGGVASSPLSPPTAPTRGLPKPGSGVEDKWGGGALEVAGTGWGGRAAQRQEQVSAGCQHLPWSHIIPCPPACLSQAIKLSAGAVLA